MKENRGWKNGPRKIGGSPSRRSTGIFDSEDVENWDLVLSQLEIMFADRNVG